MGSAIQRRKNPAYEIDDDRKRVWARVERARGPLRLGATVAAGMRPSHAKASVLGVQLALTT